ncbi:MAG: PIN domain-containing protein [Acidobacteriota bacterium]
MKRVVVDTNVLVSFLTDRDKAQQARATALFERVDEGDIQLILHQAVITELVYVLRNLYKIAMVDVAQTLEDLLSLTGVRPVDEVSWTSVLDLWPSYIGDFADAVLAAVTLEARYDMVATFDQRFIKQLGRQGIDSYW